MIAKRIVEAPAVAAPEASPASRDIVDELWSLFSSTRLALFLLLTIAVASLGGTLVMQAPTEVQQSADALRTWIERTRPKYGAFTDLFQAIGFFWIFQSLWFRTLIGLLAINTAVCTANRLPGIWRQASRPLSRPHDALFERARAAESIHLRGSSREAATELFTRTLRGSYYRAEAFAGEHETYVSADRFRWASFGTLLTHGALLLVMVGAVVSAPLGFFEESGFAVPIGSTRAIGHGTGLAVRADDFADEYHPDGRPKDYRSELVLFENGREVARQTVRVNEPLIYNGVRLHQSFYGPAALVAVTAPDGTTVFRDAVALIWRSNDGLRPVGYFPVPGRDLHVYLVGSAGEDDPVVRPGEVLIEAYEGMVRTPTYRATLTQRQPLPVAELQMVFERELPFTGLRVVYDPGEIVIWIACTLLVAGITITFALAPRQLWARLRTASDGVDVVVVGGRAAADDVARIVELFASAVGPTDAHRPAADAPAMTTGPIRAATGPVPGVAASRSTGAGRRLKRKRKAAHPHEDHAAAPTPDLALAGGQGGRRGR